jgi:hypothetical protein
VQPALIDMRVRREPAPTGGYGTTHVACAGVRQIPVQLEAEEHAAGHVCSGSCCRSLRE